MNLPLKEKQSIRNGAGHLTTCPSDVKLPVSSEPDLGSPTTQKTSFVAQLIIEDRQALPCLVSCFISN